MTSTLSGEGGGGGDTHYDLPFEGGEGKNEMVLDVGG